VSKIAEIRNFIDGAHVLGKDGLRDYHTAERVRNALRIRSSNERFEKIKSALHAYRVTVLLISCDPCQIRIRRNDQNKEIVL
jgi:hypothetical protein